jgi:prepilin-type N-terminal cleavage/methylation domain-containing protein
MHWAQTSKLTRQNGDAGFTMMEVMIVVVIIMVAAVLGVPNFVAWKQRSQLKQELVTLHTNLNLSRMAAMSRNTTITVTVVLNAGRVTATFTDPSATSAACLASAGSCVLPSQVMSADVTAVGGTTTFQFTSLGLRLGGGTANQSVTLTNVRGTSMDIQVTPAGKSRWCTVSPCP